MYIRWRKYELSKRRGTSLRAEIVQSFRHPVTGEPRNKFIGYLASIKANQCSEPVAQERFWQKVDTRLSEMNLTPSAEHRIKTKLLERVARPRTWAEIIASVSSIRSRAAIE